MFRIPIVIGLALVSSHAFGERPTAPKSLLYTETQIGETYQIATDTCNYRIRILNPAKGEVRIQQYINGVASVSKNAFLLGATQAHEAKNSLVFKNEIRVGMNLEIGYGTSTAYERITTDEVLKVERVK